jgi:hypothetical protein
VLNYGPWFLRYIFRRLLLVSRPRCTRPDRPRVDKVTDNTILQDLGTTEQIFVLHVKGKVKIWLNLSFFK